MVSTTLCFPSMKLWAPPKAGNYEPLAQVYNSQQRLVTITPLVVLGPDVLVRVLDALLQGRQVLPVLPVLVPEDVRVDAGRNDADGDDTVWKIKTVVSIVICSSRLRSCPSTGGGLRGAGYRTAALPALPPCRLSGLEGSDEAAVGRSVRPPRRLLSFQGNCIEGGGDVIRHGDLLPESYIPRLRQHRVLP